MEINCSSTSYIIRADEIDLNVLSRRYQNNHSVSQAQSIPIWSANRPADEYYEFEVSAERLREDIHCKENQTKQLCHICNIDVPTVYLKEHNLSDMHKTCLKIIENAMERLKMHAIDEKHDLTEKSDNDTFFCEFCCDSVRKIDKNLHDASRKHEMASKYCEKIKSFQNDYIDKAEFYKQFEVDKNEDSIGSKKKKRYRKNAQKKADLLLESQGNKVNEEISTNGYGSIIGSKSINDILELTMNEKREDMTTLEKLENTSKTDIELATAHKSVKDNILEQNNKILPKIDIEPTKTKTDNLFVQNNTVPEVNEDNVAPTVDPKINMKTWFQEGIQLENARAEIGLTISFNTGHKVFVSMANYHGLHGTSHGFVQCRLCRVLVDHEDVHVAETTHMQYVQRRIEDQHCIRQLDGWIWSHCMICNENIESKEVHITTHNHISRLQQATIAGGTNQTNTSETFTQTTINYCNVCDIVMPVSIEAKKIHRLTADHINNATQAAKLTVVGTNGHVISQTQAAKLTVVGTNGHVISQTQAAKLTVVGTNGHVISQYTAGNSQNTASNSQNYVNTQNTGVFVYSHTQKIAANPQNIATNSQNKDVPVKLYPAIKENTNKHVTSTITNVTKNNAAKVQNVIERTKTRAICRVCKVHIPNSNTNIKDHLNGKLHKNNLSEAKTEENGNKTNNNKENVTNTGKVKLETAKSQAIATPSTSIVAPKVTTANIVKLQTKTIAHPIEVTDNENQAMCQICNTHVPNRKSNIDDHLIGKRHTTSLKKLLSDNKMVKENGEYFCEVCRTKVLKANVLKHLKTLGHRNQITLSCKEYNGTMPNSTKTPVDIQPAQNRDEAHAIKSSSTNDVKIFKDNMISCFICKVQIHDDEAVKTAHYNTDSHIYKLNKALAPKRETEDEVEVKVKRFICLLCNTEVRLSKVMAHLTKTHSDISDSLLHDSLKTHFYILHEIENNSSRKYECLYCKTPPFIGKLHALLHMLGEMHLNVFAKVIIPEDQNNDTDTINLEAISQTPSTSKIVTNVHTKFDATTKLLKALKVNEIDISKTKIKNSDQENVKHYDAIHSEVGHCSDSKDQYGFNGAVDVADDNCQAFCKVTKVNVPEHSKTVAKQNDVLKEIESKKTTQAMPSYSLNVTESPAVNDKTKLTNLSDMYCHLCVMKSRHSPNDIALRLIELHEASKIKYGADDIIPVCSSCENIVKKLKEINKGNNDKEVKPKQENVKINQTTNETKPSNSVRNDALNEDNISINTSVGDDWFDADDKAFASAEEKDEVPKLPDNFKATDDPEKCICAYCETIVHRTDKRKHVNCMDTLLTKLKEEIGGHYEFLQQSTDPSNVLCVTCDETFGKTVKHIGNHLKIDKHDYCYQKLLEANIIVDDVTSKMYDCKVCKVSISATNLMNHINVAAHKTNLELLPYNDCFYNLSKKIEEKVTAAVMFKKHVDVVFTHNQTEYYCEFCDKLISATSASLTEHIIDKSHFENFKHTLKSNRIDIVANKYYCICCSIYLDAKLFNHLSTVTHKLNNKNITYKGIGTEINNIFVLPNTSTESNETKRNNKEMSPKMLKTCESIWTIQNGRLFCMVCKLEFDAYKEECNKHLNSKTHLLMLEVMLSANGIEDREDDYMCLICSMYIPGQLVMQHVETNEHHQLTLQEMLHARGRHIFTDKTASCLLKK